MERAERNYKLIITFSIIAAVLLVLVNETVLSHIPSASFVNQIHIMKGNYNPGSGWGKVLADFITGHYIEKFFDNPAVVFVTVAILAVFTNNVAYRVSHGKVDLIMANKVWVCSAGLVMVLAFGARVVVTSIT